MTEAHQVEMSRCYICGRGNSDAEHYHKQCLGNVFRTAELPQFDYSLTELNDLLKEQALSRVSLPGDKPMLAFHCKSYRWRTPQTWSLLPEPGEFILDLPTPDFPYLLEARHFYLNFATALGFENAPCALVKLRSKEFALFRRRFDRTTKEKMPRHIEDFCQLEGLPSRMKYWYSMEDAADLIRRFSDMPTISLVHFFERSLFYFISGCGDVHYKNLRMLCRRVAVGNYQNRVSKYGGRVARRRKFFLPLTASHTVRGFFLPSILITLRGPIRRLRYGRLSCGSMLKYSGGRNLDTKSKRFTFIRESISTIACIVRNFQ